MLEKEDIEDQYGAPEPWLEAIAEPSAVPTSNLASPIEALQLEWIHGYRAQDCRQNLFYTASGALVYPAAHIVVKLDTLAWQQKFMTEHNDQVSALAVSPDRKLVASCQEGRRPSIIVWDALTMTILKVLKGFHRRSVVRVVWSADSRLLASIGADDDHSLAGYLICSLV